MQTANTDYAGIIFDMDGTLVDSRLDFTLIRDELDCPEGIGVLEFIDTLPRDRQPAAHKVVLRHERNGAMKARWMPGAKACLERLAANGIPTAILTRNAREITALTIERLGIPISHWLAREDAPPKPAPEGLLSIAADWQLDPASVAYVGDFEYDLLAARNAGMVGVYYDGDGRNLHGHLADRTIRHFDEL